MVKTTTTAGKEIETELSWKCDEHGRPTVPCRTPLYCCSAKLQQHCAEPWMNEWISETNKLVRCTVEWLQSRIKRVVWMSVCASVSECAYLRVCMCVCCRNLMQKQQQRDASVASSASSAFLGASQNERNECNFKHVLTASASSAAAAAAAALCFIDRDRKARRKRNRRKQQLHARRKERERKEKLDQKLPCIKTMITCLSLQKSCWNLISSYRTA